MVGSGLTEYPLAIGVIFLVNLLPAFGPPTWSLLVFFTLSALITKKAPVT